MIFREWDIGYFIHRSSGRSSIQKRGIENRLVAWELDDRYYDGIRDYGYGGFNDDHRWDNLFTKIKTRYNLDTGQLIVDLGCKKGFILESAKKILPTEKLLGIENHSYPLRCASESIKGNLVEGPYWRIPLLDNQADFLIAFSSIYMQNLGEVVKTLREIQRVAQGRSYITLGAYRSEQEKKAFLDWTLIGTTVLNVGDWNKVLNYAGYTGDVFFTTPEVLGLM